MDLAGHRYNEFWARNVARRREVGLAKSLFHKPLLEGFSGTLQRPTFFCDRDTFSVATETVTDFGEPGVHYCPKNKYRKLQKAQRKRKAVYTA